MNYFAREDDNYKTYSINTETIVISPERHRKLNESLVKTLAKSMKESGLISPIQVRRGEDDFILIAGQHRLEAARALQWDCIPAHILEDIDALEAEAIELRENLHRGELTPAERALHVAALKTIMDRIYKRKAGRGKKEDDNRPQKEGKRTAYAVQAMAAETGMSESLIERDAGRAEHVPLAEIIGTSLDSGVEIDALAKLSEDEQAALIERAKNGEKVSAKTQAKKSAREKKETELAEKQKALPKKKYGVIYADPPWKFEVRTEEGMDRSADNHYPVMTTDQLEKLPIGGLGADDSVMFMWATAPMLIHALNLMDAWGYEYKSHCIWAKNKAGTGYWFRNKHELLLVGVRGKIPAPAMGTQSNSIIERDVGKHSEKPDAFHELIEGYFPNLPKIELFAREAREGWDVWGKEAPATK